MTVEWIEFFQKGVFLEGKVEFVLIRCSSPGPFPALGLGLGSPYPPLVWLESRERDRVAHVVQR